MLGKFEGSRARGMVSRAPAVVLGILLALALGACPKNVAQDAKTGADGRTKGAKKMKLENGEAVARGIVTYPGGDRVDWKEIQIPEGKAGSLELALTWQTPRPKLQLGIDVFDEYGELQASAKGRRGRSREVVVDAAKGKYLVRVYALDRGDAGKYRLSAKFVEKNPDLGFDPLTLEIADPPKLAGIPAPEIPCDPFAFDPKNPSCRSVCPPSGAPPGWPACSGVCPTPPDINNEACWPKMKCPNPPDARVRDCWDKMPCPTPPDPNVKACKIEPIIARIISVKMDGNEATIVISAGSQKGVAAKWTGEVLRGDTDRPLEGGKFTVAIVRERQAVAKVKLTSDTLQTNQRVRLSPP